MYVRLLLSVGLLACLVATETATTPENNITRFLLRFGNKTEYNGVLIYKDGHARKLVDGAAAIIVFYQPHAVAYIGGKDGIYKYDDSTEKLEKYGTVDDSVIGIAKSNNTDTLYIITEDNSVYKITKRGTKKTKVEGVEGAKRIELDWDDNLYFIGTDNQVYVVTVDGVKKIQGLPPNDRDASLYKALPEIEHGLNLLWGRVIYYIFSDGTSRVHELSAEEKAMVDESVRETSKFIDIVEKEIV